MGRCVVCEIVTHLPEETVASALRAGTTLALKPLILIFQLVLNLKNGVFLDCYADEGGAKFLRNVGSYKSHTA
jgi:hypothetical protein